ncbi:MAG: glycosylase [Chlorobi bacterium]|nr:glycosylase [Chlorobiota bacterium]
MKTLMHLAVILLCVNLLGCQNKKKSSTKNEGKFAKEMVEFTPYEGNPLFSGTNTDTWDKKIRERGYILFEDGIYKMWYSGYKGEDTDPKYLGYATSKDGINWERYSANPIFSGKWTEDMFVIKNQGTYYMYAEGENDIAHLLTSEDGINWQEQGDLIILTVDGDTIPGPYGTPTVWIEDGTWHLFYERNDEAIWLAVSDDHITWVNVQDEPVIDKGPKEYDAGAVAANQVVKFKGKYYIFYHASSNPDWSDPDAEALWSSDVAMSTDLINWEKYPGNPIVKGDSSSPILVFDGKKYRLYTMHDKVCMYLPKPAE